MIANDPFHEKFRHILSRTDVYGGPPNAVRYEELQALAHEFPDRMDAPDMLGALSLEAFHAAQDLALVPTPDLPMVKEYLERALAHADAALKAFEEREVPLTLLMPWRNYIAATIAYFNGEEAGLNARIGTCGAYDRIVSSLLGGLRREGNVDYARDYERLGQK